MKFEIKNRFTGAVQFAAEIKCDGDASTSIKLGLAVRSAILHGADLGGADLYGAYLGGVDLRKTNLCGPALGKASLGGATLGGAKSDVKTVWPPLSILAEGTLNVWKKLKNNAIANLEIPAKAKRINSTGRKCRAEFAKVLSIVSRGGKKINIGHASHDGTEYKVGKIVKPDKYDHDFRVECSHGIHFFITREEAENYE